MSGRTIWSKAAEFATLSVCLCVAGPSRGADQCWPVYLGDHLNTHYSSLKQINRHNVGRLKVAWVYHCGDAQGDRTQIQCNPLIVDGVLYATSPRLKALAWMQPRGANCGGLIRSRANPRYREA